MRKLAEQCNQPSIREVNRPASSIQETSTKEEVSSIKIVLAFDFSCANDLIQQEYSTYADGHQSAFFPLGTSVALTGLVRAVHLNGERGKIVSEKDERGRWGVQLHKTGEIVGVNKDNMARISDGIESKQDYWGGKLSSLQNQTEILDQLKRMAYAFVKQDFYKLPRNERPSMTQSDASRAVAARYQCILEEYCRNGRVDTSGYEYFDAPDSPVPIFGAELDALLRSMSAAYPSEDTMMPPLSFINSGSMPDAPSSTAEVRVYAYRTTHH